MDNTTPPTVERLLAAIRKRGEFPAMAQTVGSITSLTSSEATSSSDLADTILQDYGLTQMVLRLVNTMTYAQHDEITTITRAVLLLGFDRIRSITTGLVLFEHLQQQARTPQLVDTLNMSFFSAVLGRTIASDSGYAEPEEAFICSLFHRTGRLLVAFYLPEEHARIAAAEGDLDAAARDVLGVSFEELGSRVADELRLPRRLGDSMVRVSGSDVHRALTPGEQLACVATLANDITDALSTKDDARRQRATAQRLVAAYATQFSIPGTIDDLITRSIEGLRVSSNAFKLDLRPSSFITRVGSWGVDALETPGTAVADASSAGALVPDAGGGEAGSELPETILTKGLHEITSLLIGPYAVDDVLKVTLETIYRALGVAHTRVFLLLKDPTGNVARFRFGFGQASSALRPWFEVPIKGTDDLFSLALTQLRDLVIKDATAPEVVRLLPDWFTSRGVPDRYLVLLPLVVGDRSIGLIYVDGEKSRAQALTPAIVNYLKVLRGQAVLAIRHKATAATPRTARGG